MPKQLSLRPMVFLLVFAVGGCGYGPKVQRGGLEVFYTDGATKEEADRLLTYLIKTWGDTGEHRSAQLRKSKDGYQFRMVVKKEFQQDAAMLANLQFDAARISRDVFNGAAVELHVCDETLKTLKVLPPRTDVRYGIVDHKVEVFYGSPDDKADAERLLKYVVDLIGGAESEQSLKFARRDGVIEVHMVIKPGLDKDPAFKTALQQDARNMSSEVFGGKPVEIHMCDERLNVLGVVRP